MELIVIMADSFLCRSRLKCAVFYGDTLVLTFEAVLSYTGICILHLSPFHITPLM